MPKYEVGRKVFLLCLLAIAALTVVGLAVAGAEDLAALIINGIFKLHATPGMEGIAS